MENHLLSQLFPILFISEMKTRKQSPSEPSQRLSYDCRALCRRSHLPMAGNSKVYLQKQDPKREPRCSSRIIKAILGKPILQLCGLLARIASFQVAPLELHTCEDLGMPAVFPPRSQHTMQQKGGTLETCHLQV